MTSHAATKARAVPRPRVSQADRRADRPHPDHVAEVKIRNYWIKVVGANQPRPLGRQTSSTRHV